MWDSLRKHLGVAVNTENRVDPDVSAHLLESIKFSSYKSLRWSGQFSNGSNFEIILSDRFQEGDLVMTSL
jgi:hypothetical protein